MGRGKGDGMTIKLGDTVRINTAGMSAQDRREHERMYPGNPCGYVSEEEPGFGTFRVLWGKTWGWYKADELVKVEEGDGAGV